MSTETRRPFHRRRIFWIAAFIVAVPIIGLAWYLGSPLFLNKTVIEEFPRAAGPVTSAEVVPEEVETAARASDLVANPPVEETPDDAAPTALLTGRFQDADSFHRGSGTATIYDLGSGERVLRFENLDVTNGPDLHVILTPVGAPTNREEVHAAGYVDLGGLKGNRGDQNYGLPEGVDVTSGEWSVVIYCQPFHVIFSVAALS